MATSILMMLLGLVILVKGADFFIDSSVKVGRFLNLPSFVVGVILVGFGTSLPELVSSILAVPAGSSEIVVGNVLGSNITNILLVLGLAGLLGGDFLVKTDLLKFDLPVLAGGAILLALMIRDGEFSTGEGVICLVMLAIYLAAMMLSKEAAVKQEDRDDKPNAVTWLLLAGSPIAIFFGAKFTVNAVIDIAEQLQIGTEVIALSAVALGTSLPEVVVAISAARHGEPEIVVGNVLGSNIFNTFAVMGVPSLLGNLTVPQSVLAFSLPTFFGVTLLLVFVIVDRRMTKAEGAFLITFYAFFIGRLFAWI